MLRAFLVLIFIGLLTSCASSGQAGNEVLTAYDFDHQLEYKQLKLKDEVYKITVVAQQKTRFAQMSAFLLRRALAVCGHYGFKMVVLAGIEDFDQRRSFPNYISQSLQVVVECSLHENGQ
jgi:hypothetical protein